MTEAKLMVLFVVLVCLTIALHAEQYFNSSGPDSSDFQITRITHDGIEAGAISTRDIVLSIELTVSGQISLSWGAVPNAASYKIYHAAAPVTPGSAAWTLLTEVTGLSHTFAPASALRFYYVTAVVEAVNTLVFVQGGTFNNGTSNVSISSFHMDKYEVTQGSFQSVTGSAPFGGYGIGANYPAYFVTWFDAILYSNMRSMQEGLTPCYSIGGLGTDPVNWPANWAAWDETQDSLSCNWNANGYRLPTEMEWMFAAKGGTLSQGYTYSGSNNVDEVAWYSGNAGNTTHEVGTKAQNELGLYDMSGNVWELVWDRHANYPTGDQTDPTGPETGLYRTDRGGSFLNTEYYSTVTERGYISPRISSQHIGFRVCSRY